MENKILGDKIGPRYVVKVYNKEFDAWGFLVIDNTKLGPGKGGIRMTPTVSEEEVSRLARAMTLKNALAGIAFGGAKSGIAFDPRSANKAAKKKLVEWFAKELKPLLPKFYIAGPDVNMGEEEMAWFVAAAKDRKAATGKPKRLKGLPHELGSTGYGVVEAVKLALKFKKIDIKGATVAIEGFGNVGTFAMQFLTELGAKVVAVSDSKGTIYSADGLNYAELMKTKKKTGSVTNYRNGPSTSLRAGKDIFELPVDVLIPAALPDVINEKNMNAVKAKIIVEGANISMTTEAEKKLHDRGVLIVPGVLANAGGVISSFAEHKGYSADKMFKLVKEKIGKSVSAALARHAKTGLPLSDLAAQMAWERLS